MATSGVDQLLNQLAFQNRNRIKNDAVNLTASYRTLNMKIGTLSEFTNLFSFPQPVSVQNNGASLRVLDIEGTIPVVYCGTQVWGCETPLLSSLVV
jgi:hypothetical protein